MLDGDRQHIEDTVLLTDVNLCVLGIKAQSAVISLSRCRQPNLNKSFIAE